MMKSISIRIREDFMKETDKLAKAGMVDKSVILREALEKGLAEVKLDSAIGLFGEGKVSTSEAAEIAGISIGEMMDEIVKRGLKPGITKEDVKGSLESSLKKLR
jgi:predicted HTH domain antitoxin